MRSAAYPLNAGDAHQSADLVAADAQAGPAGGVPHLAYPVHAPVAPIQVDNLVHQIRFGEFGAADRASPPAVVGLRAIFMSCADSTAQIGSTPKRCR